MAGIGRTMKKVFPKELVDPVTKKVREESISSLESLHPKMPVAADDKVIPLPDEEELERQRRRKGRGGGRASTVLTSDDEGLGG